MESVWGEKVKITIWGESHAPEIGVNIQGLRKGMEFSLAQIQDFMQRRRSRHFASTPRREKDRLYFRSGIEENEERLTTTGKDIEIVIKNEDIRPGHYCCIPRPSHADYPAMIRYGEDYHSGGGAFSGRMTAPLCAAGAIASQILRHKGIEIAAYTGSVGEIKCFGYNHLFTPSIEDIRKAQQGALSIIRESDTKKVENLLSTTLSRGDSVGGTVECVIKGLETGFGGPLFDGIESILSPAVFAIPAVKGVEFGSGFALSPLFGSQANDPLRIKEGKIICSSNHSGGISGGMANGMDITMRVAIKPTPSISLPQESVDLKNNCNTSISIQGRHDVCIVPRAVVCIEAAVAIALLQHL